MKTVSVVTPTYNEEENIKNVYTRVKKVFSRLPKYRYEHIFIDNASTDGTEIILRKLAEKDRRVKVIFNVRNFGWVRSEYYGVIQAEGDAVILLVSDLQDPPELFSEFLKFWEMGYRVVAGVKEKTGEKKSVFFLRKLFYRFVSSISETGLIRNFSGFGLYDQSIIRQMRMMGDSYPYLRGIVSELGYPLKKIPYSQEIRRKGRTKSDIFMLLDMALLGIVSYSRLPLRLITITGMLLSFFSLLVVMAYIFLKIVLWNRYQLGMATLVIGLFFFSSVQMMFIGIIGEYLGIMHTRMNRKPLVIERERINWKREVIKQ